MNSQTDTDGPGMDDDTPTDDTTEAGPPPPPGASTERPRRLVRSRDRRIAGVAGGVAQYFNIDPVLTRLGFVVAMFAGGTGLVAYLIAWVVLPEEDEDPEEQPGDPPRRVDRSTALAVALLALAVIVGLASPFDDNVVTPLLLIAAGIYLLHQRPLDPAPGPEIDPPAASASTPSTEVALIDTRSTALDWQPGDGRASFESPPEDLSRRERRQRRKAEREPATLTRITLALIATFFAAAVVVDQLDWIEADLSSTVAISLLMVGAAGVVAVIVGGGRGLIPLGILLALTFAVSLAVEPVLEDGVGEREYVVTDIAELDDAYRLGIGRLVVDLSDLEIPPGERVELDVELGIGQLRLTPPPDVDLEVEGDVGIGELDLLGETQEGIRNELVTERDSDSTATLVVDLSVGIGQGKIETAAG